MSTPDDLRTDAIEEMENDHRLSLHDAGEHQEQRDPYCSSCETELADAIAEHAWMGRAVKTWTGGNPYAPDREGQPEFNGAFR